MRGWRNFPWIFAGISKKARFARKKADTYLTTQIGRSAICRQGRGCILAEPCLFCRDGKRRAGKKKEQLGKDAVPLFFDFFKIEKIFLDGMYKTWKPSKNIGIQRNAVSKVSRFIFPLFKKPWRAAMFSTVFLYSRTTFCGPFCL